MPLIRLGSSLLGLGGGVLRSGSTPGSLLFNGSVDGEYNLSTLSIPRWSGGSGTAANVGGTTMTVEFWIRANSSNTQGTITAGANVDWQYGNIICDGDVSFAGAGRDTGWGFALGSGRIAFGLNNSTTARTIGGGTSTADLRDNTWHHIAGTFDPSDGSMALYLDGSQIATGTGPTATVAYLGGTAETSCGDGGGTSCEPTDTCINFGIEKSGFDNATYPGYFGYVSEIRGSTIERWTAGFTPTTSAYASDGDTAFLYHLGEGSGTTATDSSSNGITANVRVGGSGYPQWSALNPFS